MGMMRKGLAGLVVQQLIKQARKPENQERLRQLAVSVQHQVQQRMAQSRRDRATTRR
ncbi:MAG: hypothetical protein ACTHMZ_01275 [Actinomycetes bacterium]